jgi:hypothetical protein
VLLEVINYQLKFNEVRKFNINIVSPMVEMYVYKRAPFNQDTTKFIGVKINDSSTSFNNNTLITK